MSAVVQLVDVSKRLGGRWALARLSVDLPQGAAVLLTGENGAGKTTLLRLMATLQKPTLGSVRLFGQDAFANVVQARARIGFVSSQTQLYDAQSGRENLRFLARFLGAEARIEPVLERVSMREHADRPMRTYSLGMRRRIALAALLLKNPELVLLDEPWSALDPSGLALMDDVVRELVRDGKTLVVATHDIERAKTLCNLHVVLEQGRMPTPPMQVSA